MGLPFTIRTTRRSLVVTFDRPCQVVSWAPLLGGFRSNVSHVLFEENEPDRTHQPDTALRRSTGYLGLKGAVVGMLVNGDVGSHKVVSASDDEIQVWALATRHRHNAAQASMPAIDFLDGLASVLIFTDRRLSHEAMLESMALGVEIRVKLGGQKERLEDLPEPIAIASHEDSKRRFSGNHAGLRKLILRTLVECLSSMKQS